MRTKASRWTSTSASTNTSTSPDARCAPALRASAGPALDGPSTTMISSGGAAAASIAALTRSSVSGPFGRGDDRRQTSRAIHRAILVTSAA